MHMMRVKDALAQIEETLRVIKENEQKLEDGQMEHTLQLGFAVRWDGVSVSEVKSALDQLERALRPFAKDRPVNFNMTYVPTVKLMDDIRSEIQQALEKRFELEQNVQQARSGGKLPPLKKQSA